MKRKRLILLILMLSIFFISVFLFSNGSKLTDADLMIKDNNTPPASRGEIVEFLNEFVASVVNHNKETFLSLFSKNSVIEDPAGSLPIRNRGDSSNTHVESFYESNLAPNNVTFVSSNDIICGMDVVRDGVSRIYPEPDYFLEVHTYSFYQLTREDNRIKIDYLRAFWEMDKMAKQIQDMGFTGIKLSMRLSWIMFINHGISGLTGFLRASSSGIFDEGKTAVSAFAEAVNSNDSDRLISLFKDNNSIIKYVGNGKQYSPQSYLNGPGRKTKIAVSDLRSTGWYTACRFNLTESSSGKHGIAIFQFNPESKKIAAVRFYWNQ